MRKLIYALAIALFAVSCGGKKEVVEQKLPMSVKTDAIPLKVDTIKLKEEHIYASKYFLSNDSVLIVVNKQNDSVEFLQVYGFPEQRLISKFMRFGRGPSEIIWAHIYSDKNQLIVKTAGNRNAIFLPVDSLLNPSYKPVFYNFDAFTQRLNQYDENRILLENPYCFVDKEKGIVNDAERFVVIDNNYKAASQLEVFGEHKYQSQNVTGGEVLVNKNSIVYASNNFPYVEFYSHDLELQKKFLSPDDIKVNYGCYDMASANELVFINVSPQTFTESCSTDDYIYLCYNGDYLDETVKDLDTWIFQFDWDGNYIKSYFCDRYISALSKSKDEDIFYATVLDDNDMEMFVKLSAQ